MILGQCLWSFFTTYAFPKFSVFPDHVHKISLAQNQDQNAFVFPPALPSFLYHCSQTQPSWLWLILSNILAILLKLCLLDYHLICYFSVDFPGICRKPFAASSLTIICKQTDFYEGISLQPLNTIKQDTQVTSPENISMIALNIYL